MNKHDIFMNCAEQLSNFSKCVSLQVGCVIVNENERIISTGVNGSIPKTTNCCDIKHKDDEHHEWSLKNEIHAEMNAIIELATTNSSYTQITFYVTHSPCENCFKHILALNRNTKKVVAIIYKTKYHRLTDEALAELKQRALEKDIDFCSLEEARDVL